MEQQQKLVKPSEHAQTAADLDSKWYLVLRHMRHLVAFEGLYIWVFQSLVLDPSWSIHLRWLCGWIRLGYSGSTPQRQESWGVWYSFLQSPSAVTPCSMLPWWSSFVPCRVYSWNLQSLLVSILGLRGGLATARCESKFSCGQRCQGPGFLNWVPMSLNHVTCGFLGTGEASSEGRKHISDLHTVPPNPVESYRG